MGGILGIFQVVLGTDQIMSWSQSAPTSLGLETTKVSFSLTLHILAGLQRCIAHWGHSTIQADGEGPHERERNERARKISHGPSNALEQK